MTVMEKNDYLEVVERPLLTQEGDTIARLCRLSHGVLVEDPKGRRRTVNEHALFMAGIPSRPKMSIDLNLPAGKWVTAREALG